MSKTSIEWCHRPGTIPETWNPTTGCNKVSPGCKFCYAEVMHRRLRKMQPKKYFRPFLAGAYPYEPALEIPLKWKKPRTVFVDSMSDLFHENIPFDYIDKVFAVMAMTPQHTYQICTKRADRMHEYMTKRFDMGEIERLDLVQEFFTKLVGDGGYPELPWVWENYGKDDDGLDQGGDWIYDAPEVPFLPNVWLMVTVEDQKRAQERIPLLLDTPAAIRGVSMEPLLEKVSLVLNYPIGPELQWTMYHDVLQGSEWSYDIESKGPAKKLDWVVVGGESGRKARVPHPDWFRSIQNHCKIAGVPFFFKQWGEWCFVAVAGEEYNEGNGYVTNDIFVHPETGKSSYNVIMQRLGKKGSGDLLDGVTYKEFPL